MLLKTNTLFVIFVEDNATMSSIQYFENHVSYFEQDLRKKTLLKLISLISLRQVFRLYSNMKLTIASENKQNQGIDDCMNFFFH